ncbi:TetR/AcrR family transcriptional regulator [Crassaminicella profunda]|uniref:TetR/AcrR family transcriptional regulator n=1 Tax=Crassaminicella profunda TaxID=1286698 RepID=UPI001CA63596|nr:TetR/AcrR family transcriptional regulator [Crassaminicella profunda]QZY54886.1 TetR/AcrR family transcriptional regulator [Crassaminicella profunda]
MPKIIKDIEEKIFNGAFELFGEYGYKKVDMKMIAKKIGIAVGTLYNYYPNKEKLFIHVFEKSWGNTFCKLDDVLKKEIDLKKKMKEAIIVLHDEISARKGLGKALFKENIFEKDDLDKVLYTKKVLLDKVENLIKEIKKEEGLKLEDGMERRLAGTIFMIIIEMRNQYPNEKEKNIQYINSLIDCTYGK